MVKRILVDNGSSGNIIFQAAYKDLGQEESAQTRRITPHIGFSGEVIYLEFDLFSSMVYKCFTIYICFLLF